MICGEKHLPGIPDILGTFCCGDEHHDQGSSKRKGVSWLWFPRVCLRGMGANRSYSARNGNWVPASQLRACSREDKLEVDEYFYSQSLPHNGILSSARRCGWHLSLNSTVNWGPGIQTTDAMGDISHQNSITWDRFPKLSFKKPDVAGICNLRPNTPTVRWKADRIGLKLTQDRTAQNSASK